MRGYCEMCDQELDLKLVAAVEICPPCEKALFEEVLKRRFSRKKREPRHVARELLRKRVEVRPIYIKDIPKSLWDQVGIVAKQSDKTIRKFVIDILRERIREISGGSKSKRARRGKKNGGEQQKSRAKSC